jgi:hypothetical protein
MSCTEFTRIGDKLPIYRTKFIDEVGKLLINPAARSRNPGGVRTCADLAGRPEMRRINVAEAVQLRTLDRVTC